MVSGKYRLTVELPLNRAAAKVPGGRVIIRRLDDEGGIGNKIEGPGAIVVDVCNDLHPLLGGPCIVAVVVLG